MNVCILWCFTFHTRIDFKLEIKWPIFSLEQICFFKNGDNIGVTSHLRTSTTLLLQNAWGLRFMSKRMTFIPRSVEIDKFEIWKMEKHRHYNYKNTFFPLGRDLGSNILLYLETARGPLIPTGRETALIVLLSNSGTCLFLTFRKSSKCRLFLKRKAFAVQLKWTEKKSLLFQTSWDWFLIKFWVSTRISQTENQALRKEIREHIRFKIYHFVF